MYLNYYSKMRNTLGGNIEDMVAKEQGKIVTKLITESNWGIPQRSTLRLRARDIASIIEQWRNRDAEPLSEHYREFRIPKHSGGYRTLHAPDATLKYYQNIVKDFLIKDCNILCHNAVHSYVKHRNCKTAIQVHQDYNSRWFLKVDIKDFFDNCTMLQMVEILRSIHPINLITKENLETMLKICFLDGRLPQGAPTSPILSNLYMQGFDTALSEALKGGFKYTRYADDILISSKSSFDYQVISKLIATTLPLGLQIKPTKTRYGSCNGSNWNLGLMYNKDLDVTVGYRNKHLIKNKIHNLYRDEPVDKDSPEFCVWLEEVSKLKGLLGYYKFIEPEYFTALIEKYKQKGYAL